MLCFQKITFYQNRTLEPKQSSTNRIYKTKIFDKEFGKTYSELFDKRQEGDYQDFYSFEREDVQPYLTKVEDFIAEIEQYILTT